MQLLSMVNLKYLSHMKKNSLIESKTRGEKLLSELAPEKVNVIRLLAQRSLFKGMKTTKAILTFR